MCHVYNEDDYLPVELIKYQDPKDLNMSEIAVFKAKDHSHNLCFVFNKDALIQGTRPIMVERKHISTGQREGWCIKYDNDGAKTEEGWYTNGKKQGIHRSYGKYLHQTTPISSSYYLKGERHYLNDVLFHATKYDPGMQVTMDYDVVNDKIHGLVKLPRVGVTQLHIHGKLVLNDVEQELQIDLDDLTEADLFTLSMLGV